MANADWAAILGADLDLTTSLVTHTGEILP
jgi:hypothetical protein